MTLKKTIEEKIRSMREKAYAAKQRSYERHLNLQKAKRESTQGFGVMRIKEVTRPDTWCVSIENHFRHSLPPAESIDHIMLKFERFILNRMEGNSVFTEVIFAEGLGRADLVCVSPQGEIWIEEIVESEKKESLEAKEVKYPFEVRIFKVENGTKTSNMESK
jgi:hypothetical protein